MKKLYKFYWNCGRQGSIDGMFIADEKEVSNSIGEEADFGEALGKHSEVCGTIEDGEIVEVKVSEMTVKEMEEVLGSTISGYNPLKYIYYGCVRCEDNMGVNDCVWYINNDGEKICDYCVTEEEKKSLRQL